MSATLYHIFYSCLLFTQSSPDRSPIATWSESFNAIISYISIRGNIFLVRDNLTVSFSSRQLRDIRLYVICRGSRAKVRTIVRTISTVNHEDNENGTRVDFPSGDSIDISALTSFVIWHRTMLAHWYRLNYSWGSGRYGRSSWLVLDIRCGYGPPLPRSPVAELHPLHSAR